MHDIVHSIFMLRSESFVFATEPREVSLPFETQKL
jgi:hypothetical protein